MLALAAVCLAAETENEKEKAKWPRPRSAERQAEREHMVKAQLQRRDISDRKVLDAMENVPRHWFVTEAQQRNAYADRPLPIGHGQTISQPYIVALMTQLLKVEPTHKVLEIGTGSGYQAAVLNELTPKVFSIEIVKPLAEAAAKRLKDRGYTQVATKTGDGYHGWQEDARFDAIIVTAAATHIPPPLLKQLKPGGRMIIPVGAAFRVQQLMLVQKDEKGKIRSRVICAVRFVPLTGGHERRE
ncbi:MAG: protein-L-isoaspartate O-methyltransferase [Planctomycetes bacterium DG_58]|nr:MAG: protein-L-isoaspartate O-methyltransferase [Planctomycetes bacterium DG_58]